MKFLIKEKYEQIKKLRYLKEYTQSIKDQFLNEELFNTAINAIETEIKKISEEIKNIQK